MYGYRPRSIRIHFSGAVDGPLRLDRVRSMAAVPPPGAASPRRPDHTGYWAQTETTDGRVLYQAHVAGMLTALAETRCPPHDAFDVRAPYDPRATHVSLFAPPPDADGVQSDLGGASVLIGRFELPASSVSADAPSALPRDICGGGRGEVLSVSKIVDNHTSGEVHTLAILAEAFEKDQQGEFREAAYDMVNYLLGRWPFNSGFGSKSMDVYLIEVASNSDKMNGSDTYFQAKQVKDTYTEWSKTCVKAVCDDLLQREGQPFWNWAGLILNSSTRLGTSSGDQFVQSDVGLSNYIFQHEFGHSAFRLGDEYGGDKGRYDGFPPAYPNLTGQTERENIKWNDLVDSGTPIPTLGNPSNCDAEDTRSNPEPDATVGLYAGGMGYSCDIYHPQYRCVMGSHSRPDDWCEVCRLEAQRVVLQTYELSVPAPGSLRYSPITRAWSHVTTSPSFLVKFDPVIGFSRFQDMIEELTAGTPGSAVNELLSRGSGPVDTAGDNVFQAYYDDSALVGLWYIMKPHGGSGYFIQASKVRKKTRIDAGLVVYPNFPRLPTFDSAPLGVDVALFAVDDGALDMGRLIHGGALDDAGMVEQKAPGLGGSIHSVSVTSLRPRLFAAVTDELRVKVGAYELIKPGWSAKGFQALGQSAPSDVYKVRSTMAGRDVRIVAQTSAGLIEGAFDTAGETWRGAANPISETDLVDLFDVAATSRELILMTLKNRRVECRSMNLATGDWGDPVDLNAKIGFDRDVVVTSLGVAVARSELMLVILVDGVAQSAAMDLATGDWTPLADIEMLSGLSYDIGEITLHSEPRGLFLGLTRA